MEKRVDRNKELYKEIELDIANIQKNSDNSSFNNTNNTLSFINPDLFDGSSKPATQPIKQKKYNVSNHKIQIITAIIFLCLLIIIIVLAVILNGK